MANGGQRELPSRCNIGSELKPADGWLLLTQLGRENQVITFGKDLSSTWEGLVKCEREAGEFLLRFSF